MTFYHKFCQKWVDISQNQCILKAEFRFGIFGFGSANLTEISVSVVSVFTRFGRPLLATWLSSHEIVLLKAGPYRNPRVKK